MLKTWGRESAYSRKGTLMFSVLRLEIKPVLLKQEIRGFLLEKPIVPKTTTDTKTSKAMGTSIKNTASRGRLPELQS